MKETPLDKAPPGPGQQAVSLWQLDPEAFAGEMIKDVFSKVLREDVVPTFCYMQPPPPAKGGSEEPALAQISIEHAFSSPETLMNCTEFLKKHATETKAQSMMVVVRKSHLAYPCVWKGKSKKQWPYSDKQDGIFMQSEARNGQRVMFFTQLSVKTNTGGKKCLMLGETAPIDVEDFALLPRIFL